MKRLECPECHREKDLSLHITANSATIRIPVIEGCPMPSSELLLEPRMADDQILFRYSNLEGTTRLCIYEDSSQILIHCPKCEKMFDLRKKDNL